MQTMVLDVSAPRILATRLLGRFWQGAYFARTAPLHLMTLPDPPLPSPDWVRVRNRLCGICGSDLHQLFVDASLNVAPVALPSHQRIYLGHEMVGNVTEMGPDVDGCQVGQRVVRWGRADDCRARGREDLCAACARGHRVLCQRASDPRPYHPIGGGFGDSFITPASTLLPVPDDLSDEQAIFVEPTAVAIHAAWRRPPAAGEKVLVIGCGTIGYLLIQAMRALQPHCEITAVAQFPWQAAVAAQCGADQVMLTAEDGYAAVSRLTGAGLYQGRGTNRMLLGGFDVVFDVVGTPRTLQDALRWTRANGTVVLVGVYLHPMTVDLTPVWHQEVDLIGTVGHDVVTWEGASVSTFELAMRWMQQGKIQCENLLTHRFPLAEYRQAFRTALDKRDSGSIKVAFTLH
ncbi:MAG: alcohol dehydrogenase catalytic domain-containing protein [Ardenticatenales bacterium]|nr:alcohol dehydrogenase catalytic domain-containing protein [Ardenticatenales bacterium]